MIERIREVVLMIRQRNFPEYLRRGREQGFQIDQHRPVDDRQKILGVQIAAAQRLKKRAQSAKMAEIPPDIFLALCGSGMDEFAEAVSLARQAARRAGDIRKETIDQLRISASLRQSCGL